MLQLGCCFLVCSSRTRTVATSCAEVTMTDVVWVGAVTLFTFGYLVYALLVPEKF